MVIPVGMVGVPIPVYAQILGESAPGTPGMIEGELRGLRRAAAPLVSSRAAAPLDAQAGSNRFPLKRNPNLAVTRSRGLGQRVNPSFPGASPAGATGVVTPSPPSRNASDLTGAGFRAPFTGVSGDMTARQPSYAGRPAPGLPPLEPERRKTPTSEQDPYAPIGLRVGSFILRPALDASAGYDSNATRSGTNRRGSAFYRTEGELRANSQWSRHQLDLELRGAYTGYTSVDNVNRPEGDVRLALRLDVQRDLVIDGEIRSRLDTETASSVNLPGGTSGRTPFYTSGAALGATKSFGRLSIGVRALVDRSIYGDVDTGAGTASQESRNVTGYGLRLRGGYQVSPGITPFLEAGIDQRRYDTTLDASGFKRSSHGVLVRAGSSFELARTLTGEAAAGYTMRAYEDARLAALRSPTLDAALTWSVSPLTTLQARAQTEIAETTVAGSSGAVAYRGALTLTHAFLRNFTATATLAMGQTDYQKISRHETTLTGGLRLEYKFNRLMALRSSYQFETQRVNAPGEGYSAHTLMFGLRLTP